MKYFWSNWKLSKIERKGVRAILIAKEIILKNIPRDEILAIYVKGSFVRREMNEYSDVDTFTVLKHSKYIPRMKLLDKNFRKKTNPPMQFSAMSLWELKNNKFSKFRREITMSPAVVSIHLKHYRLIYGSEIEVSNFNLSNNKEKLKGMVNIFNKKFLPEYKVGKMHKHELLKQIFWLVEREQKFLGKEPPHSWRDLAKSVKDKNHIIHETKKIYFDEKTKSPEKINKLVKKLRIYLKNLEKNMV